MCVQDTGLYARVSRGVARRLWVSVCIYLLSPLFLPSQAIAQPIIAQSNRILSLKDSSLIGPSALYVDQVNGLDMDTLVRRALQHNADLLATRQQIVEARGVRRQAGLFPNPGLDVSFTTGSFLGSANEREIAVGYAQTFELGGKRRGRINVTNIGVDLAREAVVNRERLLRADVATRYGEALAAARNLDMVEDLYQVTNQSYQMTRAQVHEGETSRLALGLLQVELKRLEADQLLFESQVERSILALKPLIGLPLEEPLRLAGELSVPPATLSLDKALAHALEVRPDLRAIRLNEQREQAAMRLAGANAIPNLMGYVRYARTDAQFDQLGLNATGGTVPLRDTDNVFTAGVSIAFPIFNRNQGNRHAAQARYEAAQNRVQYVEQLVRQDVLAVYSRYEAAQRALTIFDEGVITQAITNLRVIREAYQLGEIRLLDVITEQRRLIETQRAYTDVSKEYYLAQVALERAIGGPIN